jgi:hypothetical protein
LSATSDGTLYAAIKTSYDGGGRPEIMLLVRRPNGVWDNAYTVDSKGTRPIVVVNEAAGKLIVAYSPSDSGGDTMYRESPLGNISFGARQVLISGSNNNVTSTKYTSSNEIVFLSGSSSTARGVRFSFNTGVPQVVNLPPAVNAGANRTTVVGTAISVDATVTDDGRPTPVSLSTLWSQISGPGAVTIGNANAVDTTFNFSAAGTYVLRLTASDGQLTGFDEIAVTVTAAAVPNVAPSVNAGNDRTTFADASISIDATVTDDGQPTSTIVTTWSTISGPGTVTFGNANAVDTTATFSAAGNYVLRLTADDGQLTTFDEITVSVGAASQAPQPPSQIAFQDGLFPYVSYAGTTDTKIVAGKPTTNYGSVTSIDVDGSPDIAALLRWDVSAIPVGSIITSVAIDLYVSNSSKQNFEVYALQKAWDEFSATWQRFAANGTWSTAGATGGADRSAAVLGALGPGGTGIQRILLNAAGIAAVQAWINNPASNFGIILQDYGAADGVDIATSETSNASRRPKLVITYEAASAGGGSEALAMESNEAPPVENLPPTVSAGANLATQQGSAVGLDGTVNDDGQPVAGAAGTEWIEVSGPGTVTFGNAAAVDTSANFSAVGTYVLRLTATDGELSASDEVTVSVSEAPAPPITGPQPPQSTNEPTAVAFQDGLFPYVSYAGTTDTKISSGNPTTNYGAATSFDVDGDIDIAAMLRWDVSAIPTSSIVVSASLELYVSNTTKQNFEVYTLQRAWDELSATWQQYAASRAWAGAGATGGGDRNSSVLGQLGSGTTGVHRIELNEAGVAAVQAWISDSASNFGLIVEDYTATDGVDFYSSEHSVAARRPKLVINYDTPGV